MFEKQGFIERRIFKNKESFMYNGFFSHKEDFINKGDFIEKEKSLKKQNFIKGNYANLIFKMDDDCIILKGGKRVFKFY